jgi:hypothetical protein
MFITFLLYYFVFAERWAEQHEQKQHQQQQQQQQLLPRRLNYLLQMFAVNYSSNVADGCY